MGAVGGQDDDRAGGHIREHIGAEKVSPDQRQEDTGTGHIGVAFRACEVVCGLRKYRKWFIVPG